MKLKLSLAVAFVLFTPSAVAEPGARLQYTEQRLVDAGYDATVIAKLFRDRRLVLRNVSDGPHPVNWKNVRTCRLGKPALQAGMRYLAKWQPVFDDAERTYSIPKEVLVGLINIESGFRNMPGDYVVINALYSRMMQYPEDKWLAQSDELVAFIRYCLDAHRDCYTIRGSSAGAMGLVQFMPCSVVPYGVDQNGDGFVDLFDPQEAIPSAARYLRDVGYANNPAGALAIYYGNPVGYPQIVLEYAERLRARPVK